MKDFRLEIEICEGIRVVDFYTLAKFDSQEDAEKYMRKQIGRKKPIVFNGQVVDKRHFKYNIYYMGLLQTNSGWYYERKPKSPKAE